MKFLVQVSLLSCFLCNSLWAMQSPGAAGPSEPISSPSRALGKMSLSAPFNPLKHVERAEELADSDSAAERRAVPNEVKKAVVQLNKMKDSPSKRAQYGPVVKRLKRVLVRRMLGDSASPDLSPSDHTEILKKRMTPEFKTLAEVIELYPRGESSPDIRSIVDFKHVRGDHSGGGHFIADDTSYRQMRAATLGSGRKVVFNGANGIVVGVVQRRDRDNRLVEEEKTMFPYKTVSLGERAFAATEEDLINWAQQIEGDGFIAATKAEAGRERILGSVGVGASSEMVLEMIKDGSVVVTMYPIFSYVKLDKQAGPIVNLATFRDEDGAEETLSFEKGEVERLVAAALENYEAKKASGGTKGAYNPLRYDLTHDIIVDIAPQLLASGVKTPVGRGIFVQLERE